MRQITSDTAIAFLAGTGISRANTSTDGRVLLLHGNRIAWKGEHNGTAGVFITCAGWGTPTTRERLNGVLRVMGHNGNGDRPLLRVTQKDGAQYIEQERCDGLPFAERSKLIGTDGVAFVAHPITMRSIRAVTIVEGEAN